MPANEPVDATAAAFEEGRRVGIRADLSAELDFLTGLHVSLQRADRSQYAADAAQARVIQLVERTGPSGGGDQAEPQPRTSYVEIIRGLERWAWGLRARAIEERSQGPDTN